MQEEMQRMWEDRDREIQRMREEWEREKDDIDRRIQDQVADQVSRSGESTDE